MALIKDMIPSSYLKKDDFEQDTICTVQKVGKKNIAKEGDPPEVKWLCKFKEFEKPMVLNTTNIQALAEVCASEDTDDWTGKEVIVYVDPNVTFGGERKGGLRFRKNTTTAAPRKAAEFAPSSDIDDDLHF